MGQGEMRRDMQRASENHENPGQDEPTLCTLEQSRASAQVLNYITAACPMFRLPSREEMHGQVDSAPGVKAQCLAWVP